MTTASQNCGGDARLASDETGNAACYHRSGAVNSPFVLGLVVFLLALLPRALDLDVFVGPDESSWVRRSDHFAEALRSGNLAATYQSGHPGVTLLWMELPVSGGTNDGTVSTEATEETEDEGRTPAVEMGTLATKRRLAALAHACSVALTVLLVRKLFNSEVAWMAGCLLAFDPFLLTESRAVRSEGMVTSFATLSLLALLWFVQERHLWLAGLTGVLTGLALLSKVSAVALLPVVALGLLITLPLSPAMLHAPRWRSRLTALLILGMALIATVILLWPALWVAPLEVMRQMGAYIGLRAVEGGGGGSYSFFLGQVQPTRALSPLFYPLVLLYRTGPWQWAGLIGLAAVAWRAHRWTRRWTWNVAIMLAFLAAYLALISLSGLKFDRYVMPMLPVLDVMAALGLSMTWCWIAGTRLRQQLWGVLAAIAVFVTQVALALPHHPYYHTYYNPLLGGIRQAVHVLPVGTGYEGVEKVAAYLNNLPQPEQLRLATAVSGKLKPLFKGQTIAMDAQDGHWFLADYTFLYISQVQRGKHDAELVAYLQQHKLLAYSFQLAGLDYGWVYRGPGAQYYGGDTKLEGRAMLHAFDLSTNQIQAGEVLTATVYFRN
ncbi:MAG: glycosyltransferase family 39 protein [Anaerolineae bacterium]